MNLVIFGATEDATYSFPAPLVVALWKQHGYTPVMVRVGNWTSREGLLSEKAACAMGARVVPLDMQGCLYSGEWMSKIVRFMSPLLPFVQPEDMVLTTDSDMLMLDAGSMAKPDPQKWTCWNSAAYLGFEPNLFPICYCEASARVWRDIVRPQSTDLREACIRFLDKWHAIGTQRNGVASDEHILRGLLMGWEAWPHGCNLIARRTLRCMVMANRIDRDMKPCDSPIDAHLPRPCWTPEAWPKVREIAYPRLTHDQRRQLDAYVAEWTGRELDKEFEK